MRDMKRSYLIIAGLIGVCVLTIFSPFFSSWAFEMTGEEGRASQIKGLLELSTQVIRPPLDLRPDAVIQFADVNPFGINTFLHQEVEPSKRERQVQMIKEAGFYWLRQEFPWYDIEVHAKGDFEDRRHPPAINAWAKYDAIVEITRRYDLHLIARLSSPPAWSRSDGEARGSFAPPDRFSDYADYAKAVASRYKGRIKFYQLWNEPNIYPEWGEQAVSPEAYKQLLCEAYRAIKSVDADAVILAGALAPTNELSGRDLNEFVFLQRMYDAGAGKCFDIMSAQAYGLWSGPTDKRLSPINVNYARHVYLRDLMVRNGDERKAIWISEMNWNVAPENLPANYGRVTVEQQARWAPLAYERAKKDWKWIGVINFWFFKRADDSEKNQSWYYFRMVEPDFTVLPVYEGMKKYIERNISK